MKVLKHKNTEDGVIIRARGCNNPLMRTQDICKFKSYCNCLSPGEELKAKAPPENKAYNLYK